MTETKWTVQKWGQYKLGNGPYYYCKGEDVLVDSQKEADDYWITADSGISGDTRYRYKVIPPSRKEIQPEWNTTELSTINDYDK